MCAMCIVATQQHGTDRQRGGIQHGGHGEGHQTHTQGPEFHDYGGYLFWRGWGTGQKIAEDW